MRWKIFGPPALRAPAAPVHAALDRHIEGSAVHTGLTAADDLHGASCTNQCDINRVEWCRCEGLGVVAFAPSSFLVSQICHHSRSRHELGRARPADGVKPKNVSRILDLRLTPAARSEGALRFAHGWRVFER